MTFKLTDWSLLDTPVGDGVSLGIAEAPLDHPGMITVKAPGDLYLALHEAGRLPEPFGDRAAAECSWVAQQEWWYRADIASPSLATGQRLVLDFEGLDTFASVWLNGECIGHTDNMFRRWRFDVSESMQPGINRIALCFTPPSSVVKAGSAPDWAMSSSPASKSQRNLMRKAQFGWGWDFAPDLPTVGILKPAQLLIETVAVLDAVKFTTLSIAADHSSAQISLDISAEVFDGEGAALEVTWTLSGPDGKVQFNETSELPRDGLHRTLTMENPALWWTPELGAAPLHKLNVALRAGGVVLDQRELRVGIRTIKIDTSPDAEEPGTTFFRFVLNGVPIFARGVNWVPASSLLASVDEARYAQFLDLAAQANMNMIRIWGGGVYEGDSFYDLCDERGLLVWQDFMFACATYPEDDPAFVDSVKREVDEQIKRLRHHACLAVWCGNNENQAIHGFVNSKAERDDRLLGLLYYDEIIPERLAELDPTTPYRASSPLDGPKNNHNSMAEGDIHDWTVWHGLPTIPDDGPVGEYDRSPTGVAYTRYAEDMGRFISEFGIQSAPSLATFQRVLPQDQQVLGSPGFLDRIKDKPQDKVNAMLVTVTGLPDTLADYVAFTQITQAEGLKFGIEHFRRRKPHCSGTLLWQFNDCWPGVSWSIVDYYGLPKAAYYFVRRAYAPVMASFKAVDEGMELWIVNDLLQPANGELTLALVDFGGTRDWSLTLNFDVPGNTSRCVWRGEAQGSPAKLLSVRSSADLFPPNRHFFAAIKDLERPEPQAPQVLVTQDSTKQIRVRITASTHLYFIQLQVPIDHASFSDNYFELLPGETRDIIVTADSDLNPQDLTLSWR